MKQILVVVADKNMEYLMKGLFPRIPLIERIEQFSFDIQVHPNRDPGIYNNVHEFIRPFALQYDYSIVMLDHQGSGREIQTRQDIESTLEALLDQNGWAGRNCAICIYPELENWIWVSEPQMHNAISWEEPNGLYHWISSRNFDQRDTRKPTKPKEAFEAALKYCQLPRSSSIYKAISSNASYKNCQDEAFLKLLNKLRVWLEIRN